MQVTERELEDVIFFQRFQSVQDSGLLIYEHHKVIRQLSLGSFGTPDLIGINFQDEEGVLKEIHLTIYELKRGQLSFKEICQVQKYQYGIRQMLMNSKFYNDVEVYLTTALIGYSLDSSVDFMAAAAELETRLFTYKNTPKGIFFTQVITHNYKPGNYDHVWYGEARKLNLIRIFNNTQEVKFDPDKNESWISNH